MNQTSKTAATARSLATAALAALWLAGCLTARAAGAAGKEEANMKNAWYREHLIDGKSSLPFSFTYDAKPSAPLLAEWPVKVADERLDAKRTRRTLTWTDPKTGLEVRCVAVDYADYPAVEWTVWFKNIGTTNTPILEKIQGLAARFMRDAKADEFVLHGIKGDFESAEGYEPYRRPLVPGAEARFAPPDWSGKSSDGPAGWPYFNLQTPGGGVIIAVGWPGQWAASFTRDAGTGLTVRAGQQLTRLYLKPGEEIRTPLIALLFWKGAEVVEAQNLWRRWYRAHTLPRVGGEPQSPTTIVTVLGDDAERRELQALVDGGVPIDILWRDAGGTRETVWFKVGPDPLPFKNPGMIWLNSGTWEIDTVKYPQGFRPLSDWAHARGIQFMLWFEPERVGDPRSWLGKNHPEWLLPNNWGGGILNQGHPTARQWLTDHISGMIESQGLDWYREDMNGGGPCPAWRKNDAPSRQGMTENLYVQGHLAFWDELRRRHPRLRIDSCASGGRRNDLETMRRAVPLLRSDFQDASMPGVIEGNQGHTYGLSAWLPFQGTGACGSDPYAARSFYLPSFGFRRFLWWQKPENLDRMRQAYVECRKIAPMMLEGDYYPLTPYSRAINQWIAWQFNRPEQGDGVVQTFRREKAQVEEMRVKLRGLAPDVVYELTDFDKTDRMNVSGRELMESGVLVKVPPKGSAVILYRQLTAVADRKQLNFHFAVLAEQLVSPEESSSPRRPLGRLIDWTGDFERKLEYLDKVGVGTFWLYGFRAAEGTVRDIGLLKAAKAKLERLGKEANVICEPLGHPGGEPPAGSPQRQGPPGKGWRHRINAEGNPDWGSACLDDIVLRDVVAATHAFREAGFKKVFFDDDLRMGNGDRNITGCFCEACLAEFNRMQGARYSREDLRKLLQDPGNHVAVCEAWMAYQCGKVTAFMKAVNLPGIQVGIMVMCNGDRKHGVDLPAILQAVPDCLVRVGEGQFNDAQFDPPAGKAFLIASLEKHKAIVRDVSRLYSENTVDPWPNLRPENMAKKLLIEVEHGLRNIMLMPPPLLDAPEYWEAIAAVLPQAQALAEVQAAKKK